MKAQLLINIVLVIVLFFYNKEKFLEDMWVFYVLHYIALFGFLFSTIKRKYFSVLMFFSPIVFSFIYLGISFTLGAIFIPLKYGWFKDVISRFIILKDLNIYTIYIFIVDFFLLYIWYLFMVKKAHKIPSKKELKWLPFNQMLFFTTLLIYLAITFIPIIDTLTFGFSYTFKLILIIYLSLQSFSFSNKLRYLLYFVIIATIAPFHYQSKREIVLVFFIIIFIELLKNKYKIKLKLKHLLVAVSAVFFIMYFVFAASIMRGYGSYKPKNIFEAALNVPDYVQQPFFLDAFVDNFELTAVLGNSMICMNLVDNGKIPLQLGGTYLKVLLSPIPRSLWPNKPYGMVLLYSYTYNPKFKDMGMSYPVVHHVEGFTNFYWLGILLVPLIMAIFEYLFWYALLQKKMSILNGKLVFSIFAVCIIFQYIRGSGFDLVSLYIVASIPLIIIFSLIPKKVS